MTFTEAQLLVTLARVQRAHAEIVSGAYKHSKTQIEYTVDPSRRCRNPLTSRGLCQKDAMHKDPCGLIAFRDMTDEENLRSAMGVMDHHLQRAQECVDYIGEGKDK